MGVSYAEDVDLVSPHHLMFSGTSDLFSFAAVGWEGVYAADAAVTADTPTEESDLHELLGQSPPVSPDVLDSKIDDLLQILEN
jgi:hypothetical protein